MTLAVVLSAACGACLVGAVWEGLAVVEQTRLAAGVHHLVASLRVSGAGDGASTPTDRARLVAVSAVTLFGAGWIAGGPMIGVLLGAMGPWLPSRVVAWRRQRWTLAVSRGAPTIARSIADALASGQSVRGAITEAARSGGAGQAAESELRACAAALALGAPTDDVLEALRERAACAAWDTLIAAILLNRDSGGDLAGLLRDLAAEFEAARRVEADARAATAQARFTGWLVAALPAAGALLTELGAPGTLASIASQPLALLMAGTALVLQILGIVAIRRLAAL